MKEEIMLYDVIHVWAVDAAGYEWRVVSIPAHETPGGYVLARPSQAYGGRVRLKRGEAFLSAQDALEAAERAQIVRARLARGTLASAEQAQAEMRKLLAERDA